MSSRAYHTHALYSKGGKFESVHMEHDVPFSNHPTMGPKYVDPAHTRKLIHDHPEHKARKAAGWTLESMVGSRNKAKSEETAKNNLDRAVESHRRLYGESVEQVDEKRVGFEKLENELSHKGVKNPGALAAYIGRKKYGKKKFDKAAEEGKKLHEDDEHINELSGKGFINKAIAADDHSNKARTDRLLDLRTIRNNKDKTDRSSKRKVANAREWYRKDTARDRGMNIAAESVEDTISEISKEKLGKYVIRASRDLGGASFRGGVKHGEDLAKGKFGYDRPKSIADMGDDEHDDWKTRVKRETGLTMAGNKLSGKRQKHSDIIARYDDGSKRLKNESIDVDHMDRGRSWNYSTSSSDSKNDVAKTVAKSHQGMSQPWDEKKTSRLLKFDSGMHKAYTDHFHALKRELQKEDASQEPTS